MPVCYLGIGSNLGDRAQNIKRAVEKINALKATKVIRLSGLIETKPVGGPKNQPLFLNGAVKITTGLGPLSLLKKLKNIERSIGRTETVRFGARVIDLDILFYADKIISRKNLKIPHLRVFKREFVLKPLLELL